MKKQIAIFLMLVLLVAPVLQGVTAAQTVFITSDNIIDHDTDVRMLNSIKEHIEELSNGELQVIVDNQAPGSGEGYRSIQVTSDICVNIAASDAGNYLQLANYTVYNDKHIIFVNSGSYDLDNSSNYLRRAWDDNYSNQYFAGVHDPGTLLKNSGVTYIQPLKEYPDAGDGDNIDKYDEEMNKYIAQEVVNQVKNYNYESKILSDSLIVYHHIEPSIMASASKELVKSNDTEMNGTYGGYSAPQLLYQTSSYLNGNGLDNPKNFTAPESPMKFSLLTKGSYTINDYIKMGGIVKTYMDENGQAPDYINYEGAYISYYDLVYNFAKITQNHTNTQHMGFDSEYEFEKTNDSILLHVFPIILVIIVLYIAYSIWKRLRRH